MARNLSFSFLVSSDWWREAFSVAFRFAPACILPAFVLGLANVILLVGLNAIERVLTTGQPNLDELNRAAIIGLITLVSSLVLTLWSLTSWLVKLTAFSRTYLTDAPELTMKEFNASVNAVKKMWGHLCRFWFIASLYLCLPLVPLIILLTMNVLLGPDSVVHQWLSISLPGWATMCLYVGIALLSVVVVGFSLVAIVVSSISTLTANESATEVITLCLKNWQALIASACVVLLINLVVSLPQILLSGRLLSNITEDAVISGSLVQIWLAATSTVIWPLSVAPFCQFLKGQVR